MTESNFRGYHAIGEVMQRMTKLAEWTRQFKPNQQHLTLQRKDYDLLRRWPKASAMYSVSVVGKEKELWFRGLELTYDGGPKRYAKQAPPQQVDIES